MWPISGIKRSITYQVGNKTSSTSLESQISVSLFYRVGISILFLVSRSDDSGDEEPLLFLLP